MQNMSAIPTLLRPPSAQGSRQGGEPRGASQTDRWADVTRSQHQHAHGTRHPHALNLFSASLLSVLYRLRARAE